MSIQVKELEKLRAEFDARFNVTLSEIKKVFSLEIEELLINMAKENQDETVEKKQQNAA
jgi:hypothetical protein